MILQRRIARPVTTPQLVPGFIGPGHLAAQVVLPEEDATLVGTGQAGWLDRPKGEGISMLRLPLDGRVWHHTATLGSQARPASQAA